MHTIQDVSPSKEDFHFFLPDSLLFEFGFINVRCGGKPVELPINPTNHGKRTQVAADVVEPRQALVHKIDVNLSKPKEVVAALFGMVRGDENWNFSSDDCHRVVRMVNHPQ